MGELVLIIVWLVLRGQRQYNAVETGWPAGQFSDRKVLSSVQTRARIPQFCCWAWELTESSHPWKSANHSVGTLFLWKQFYLIGVTRFALSHQPPLHLHFHFCKHIHMWESTSRDVCLNLNSLCAPAGSAQSRNCGSRAAGATLLEGRNTLNRRESS